MDIDIDGAGVVYDYTGPIVILCWSSQIEKCVKRLNAVFYDLLSDVDLMVSSWLFVSLRRRRQLKSVRRWPRKLSDGRHPRGDSLRVNTGE